MSLSSGTKLGPYEIVSPLGAGGMGEVYRARDTRLDRDVAVKVLPARLAGDPMFRQRFEREARTVSSLNHPHICTLFDIGREGETDFLVMEYLEGETLAERLKRGPLALAELVRIGMQIADALDKAHRKGVVHRDLKPANIMLTKGGAKLMDFGLAKPMGIGGTGSASAPLLSAAVTADGAGPGSPLTSAGTLVGTIQYMSPEQVEGKEADARSDIFALGSTLYEMATGERAFQGRSQISVASAILEKDPEPISAKQPLAPASLDRVVAQCLAKDPDERFQNAYDVGLELKWVGAAPAEGPSSTSEESQASPLRRALPWVVAGVAMAALVAVSVFNFLGTKPQPQHVIRFSISAPENTSFSPIFGSLMSLSPDGREVAFRALSGSGTAELWVRPLDSLTARPIPGTEGAGMFFWSPDGQYIAFFANNKLEKVALSGGAPQTLCDVQGHPTGTWSRDGVILFSNADGRGLYRVAATGGTPALVIAPEENGRAEYLFPQFLPDGRHFIFVQYATPKLSIAAGALGSKKITRLMETESNALYAPPGELLYLSASTLMARPFDAGALRFTGAAVPVAENVGELIGVLGSFSVSPSGVLAYQTGLSSAQDQMAWFNREGKELGTLGPPGNYRDPMISPDGTQVVTEVGELGKNDIWVYDLKRGTGSRLTFNPANDVNPVWSPDGKQILFTSDRKGSPDIYEKASNGLGSTQLVYASRQVNFIVDVAPNGRYALYKRGSGLWVLPLGGDHKPFAFVPEKYHPGSGQFSPNGRYLAYTSGETGRNQIYVQTFPQHAGKWEISTDGGVDPVWGHDGKELYYLDPKNELMAVRVNTSSSAFQAGTPKLLFQTHSDLPTFRGNYVVSPDGKRFLMLVPAEKTSPSPITVVVNWTALLKNQ